MTISRVENACKPLILQGLQKNTKIISTHLLTVIITSVIVQIEQRKGMKKEFPLQRFHLLTTLETTSRVLMAAAQAAHIKMFQSGKEK